MEIQHTWTNLKAIKALKVCNLQHTETSTEYKVWINDGLDTHYAIIDKDTTPTTDQTDFETTYKSTSNKPQNPKDDEGKTYVRAESRPTEDTTCFTMCGDDTGIGDGAELMWDFSNSDDEITAPSGYKRKRVEFSFLDSVHVKDGTLYFWDAPWGSYFDFYVVCPTGEYYYDNDGDVHQASEDTVVAHYVIHHRLCGSCSIGDELNTEAASNEVPASYKFWLEITTPDSDSTSKGCIEMEIYRKRTTVL